MSIFGPPNPSEITPDDVRRTLLRSFWDQLIHVQQRGYQHGLVTLGDVLFGIDRYLGKKCDIKFLNWALPRLLVPTPELPGDTPYKDLAETLIMDQIAVSTLLMRARNGFLTEKYVKVNNAQKGRRRINWDALPIKSELERQKAETAGKEYYHWILAHQGQLARTNTAFDEAFSTAKPPDGINAPQKIPGGFESGQSTWMG